VQKQIEAGGGNATREQWKEAVDDDLNPNLRPCNDATFKYDKYTG